MPGATLLGGGLTALRLAIGRTTLWTRHPAFAAALLAVAAALIGVWVSRERRCAARLTISAGEVPG
ncbi:hypothetical protein ACZ90_11435 [Streptomyces albus subsp. albus]|nr:hypothetical protein ACZ90_11435 [Streptomyces albus subsp. albus]